ncbi:Wzz/FepE/Etk N-terminal domain-containing protein [Vibrio sp.]|nr:Wzz/FepE/Etk N-terminal domain-containing protein [Vibrio sp.]
MSDSNSPAHFHNLPPVPPQYTNDEIDLRELFAALWQGKLTIIANGLLCGVLAIIYALTAQEWWQSKATVTLPQIQDYSEYRLQVKQFDPIFTQTSEQGVSVTSEDLTELILREEIFKAFIREFNSTSNKRNFLLQSETFNQYKQSLDLDPSDEDNDRRLFGIWFEHITIHYPEKNDIEVVELSFQATTKKSSFAMLTNYLNFIQDKVRSDAVQNLQVIVNSQAQSLRQQHIALSTQAKQALEVETKRAEFALGIAQAAKITKPVQNLGEGEIFSINMGSAAIAAKVKALNSIEDVMVIEPRLQTIRAKLTLLNNTKIKQDVAFDSYQLLEEPSLALNREAPKRTLIVILGGLLGGMLGVAMVLIRFAFTKESGQETV